MSATGRWFITPTAVEQWQAIISPGSTYEEALADIINWSADAERKGDLPNGLASYRVRSPLRCYFAVDESEQPLPALVAVLRPHSRWVAKQVKRGGK